jgi:hypothetical protein
MQTGDRVRLREKLARTFTRNTRGGNHKLDWTKRTGEVVSVGRTSATIKWDDRKSLDHWPPAALVILPRRRVLDPAGP